MLPLEKVALSRHSCSKSGSAARYSTTRRSSRSSTRLLRSCAASRSAVDSVVSVPNVRLRATGVQRVSRIVPTLDPGGVVTVPRTYIDYVVTEQVIAELRGKTVKERARALLDVVHPDFRPHLEEEALRLHGV